jgi:hypothetical protein
MIPLADSGVSYITVAAAALGDRPELPRYLRIHRWARGEYVVIS